MSAQVLATYQEMKLRTAPHILNIALAFTTNRSTVSESDVSALLAFVDFITSEVEPALAAVVESEKEDDDLSSIGPAAEAACRAMGITTARDRAAAMKRHPAGKGR